MIAPHADMAEVTEGPALSCEIWAPRPPARELPVVAPANKAEMAAALLAQLAIEAGPDERLGSKQELRERCSVSVGTFNEALKIAQSRGTVALRRGPGGGVFAAVQSPLVRLGNEMLALESTEAIVADAQRMRNALDPLVLEDALMYSSAADIAMMHLEIAQMERAMAAGDVRAFLHGNWRFQAFVAGVSPNTMLRTVYVSLLDLLERHAVTLRPLNAQPLPEMLNARLDLYVRMANALEARDRTAVMQIMMEHNTGTQPTAEASA